MMRIPVFWNPSKNRWGFGYWCVGEETLEGDGLLCYHQLNGQSEAVREKDLVRIQRNPLGAFIEWLRQIDKKVSKESLARSEILHEDNSVIDKKL